MESSDVIYVGGFRIIKFSTVLSLIDMFNFPNNYTL
jgi:hypothetical protein